MTNPLIFCALDTDDLGRAVTLAKTIGPVTGGLKLGLEFFSRFGPHGVEKIRESCPSAALFLDLKFHDIPNTVAAAIKTVTQNLAPAYVNVHASGGQEMMEAAKAACAPATKLLAVTILTSMNDIELRNIGYTGKLDEQVARLAILAKEAELNGVVCSALEIELLRRIVGNDFTLMVPGIRPAGSDPGDQKRIMTPQEALQKGATHLVIGRPITGAPDPAAAAQAILNGTSV
ncbi:MAG: orotidine-5'-phosphate decarboxylase [Alphaproteobacteria bacterium]